MRHRLNHKGKKQTVIVLKVVMCWRFSTLWGLDIAAKLPESGLCIVKKNK